MRMDLMRRKMLENGTGDDYDENGVDEQGKNYLGMFRYNIQKENLLLSILITGMVAPMLFVII